jgi:AraC family transcriptional regulator
VTSGDDAGAIAALPDRPAWRAALPTVSVDGAGVVQVVDYQPGSSYGPRELVDYEFLWLLQGSAVWTVHRGCATVAARPGRSVTLLPGTLLLAPAGAVDSFRWDRDVVSRHAWAHFRVADPGPLPGPAEWPVVRDLAGAPVLSGLCRYLEDLGSQQSEAARARSDQLLGLLLDLFVRGPFEEPAAGVPEVVSAVVEAVRRSWAADGVRLVEVEELAAAACVSPGHLFRVFRQHYGCGPARVLELVRLSRAAVLLQRSNASLADVAAATGFANAYHLSRRFRSAYGVPPGGYRRGHATDDPVAPLREAGLLPLAHVLAEA